MTTKSLINAYAHALEKLAMDEDLAAKMEIGGLGILAAPYVARLGAKVPGVRAVAKPVADFYKKHHTFEDAAEVVGLGTLAVPAVAHLRKHSKPSMEKKAELLIEELFEKLGTDREYYRRNRSKILASARAYRASHKDTLKRKAKMYRKKVKAGAIRQRDRVGGAGVGYTYAGYK